MKRGRPLIQFEGDQPVKCDQGHDTFRLFIRMKLGGALVQGVAVCTQCGQEEVIQ